MIKSLDDDENTREDEYIDELENEKLWMEEVKRRYSNYKNGKTFIKPAEIVFREARS